MGSSTLSDRRLMPPWWLWVLILVYVAVYSGLSLIKHDNFHSFTLDLGIMTQVTWNTAYGRLFETSIARAGDAELIGSYLGNHVRPIFLLLAPLYRLWPDARLLLLLQSAALGLGAIPLFWVARRDVRSAALRFVLLLAYLLYPALGFINLFDFHPVAFCVPVLLLAYWALLEKRRALFWTTIVLALSTKEELVVPVAALGAYCLFHPPWRRTGLWLIIVAVAWAALCFLVIIPCATQGGSYRFFELWSHLLPGDESGDQSGPLFSLSVDALYFLVHLFLPLGFLPLLGPGLLAISLPSLVYLLVSSRATLHSVGFQYPAVLIPWFFLAAVQGLVRLERWPGARRMTRKWLPLGLLLVGMVGANLPFNPIWVTWRSGYLSVLPQREQILAAMSCIPSYAGVATINPFGPHLAQRRVLITLEKYPVPLRQDHFQHVDYVLLDLVDCRLYRTQDPRATYAEAVRDLIDSGDFGVRYWSRRIVLLERGLPAGAELGEVRAYVDKLVAQERPCWP